MAFTETKIIQVENSPETINRCNEVWGYFGWNVQNIQITHSQDTRTYTKGFSDLWSGDQTVETTTINYATITYQRDKNMPNYDRIVELEAQYVALAKQTENASDSSKPGLGEPFGQFTLLDWILSYISCGILIPILYLKRRSELMEVWKQKVQQNAHDLPQLTNKRENIIKEVLELRKYGNS